MQLALHLLQRQKSLHNLKRQFLIAQKKTKPKPKNKKEEGGEGRKPHLICRDKLSEFDTRSYVLFHTLTFRRKPYNFSISSYVSLLVIVTKYF